MSEGHEVSWNQRHRLGQMRIEREAGVHRPHHAVEALGVDGPLDIDALNRAWRRTQDRHPVLRCGFDRGDAGTAIIDAPFAWRLDSPTAPSDLAVLPATSDPARALSDAVDAPFDIDNGPLARLVVIQAAERQTLLGLAIDHVIIDFWALRIVMNDLTAFYAEELGQSAPPRPPILLTPSQQVRAEHAYLSSPAGTADLESLSTRLGRVGAIPAARIKGFSGAEHARYDRNGTLRRTLTPEVTQGLRATAKRSRTSVWTLMHAAVHTVIADLSGMEEVGTVLHTANRETSRVEQTVGWLANKVVIPSTPHHRRDTETYLRRFCAAMFSALDTADVPWPRAIAALTPDEVGRHTRTPYISFNPRTASMIGRLGTVAIPGCRITPVALPGSTPDPAIVIHVSDTADRIDVKLAHRLDWYDAEAVAGFWEAVEERLRDWIREAGV